MNLLHSSQGCFVFFGLGFLKLSDEILGVDKYMIKKKQNSQKEFTSMSQLGKANSSSLNKTEVYPDSNSVGVFRHSRQVSEEISPPFSIPSFHALFFICSFLVVKLKNYAEIINFQTSNNHNRTRTKRLIIFTNHFSQSES